MTRLEYFINIYREDLRGFNGPVALNEGRQDRGR